MATGYEGGVREPQKIQIGPVSGSAVDLHAPAANTAAVLTYGAEGDGVSHHLGGLYWSYTGTGTLAGGRLTVADGGSTIFDIDITVEEFNYLIFSPPLMGTPGRTMTVTLAAGGADVSGKINARHWTRDNIRIAAHELDFSDLEGSMLLVPLMSWF